MWTFRSSLALRMLGCSGAGVPSPRQLPFELGPGGYTHLVPKHGGPGATFTWFPKPLMWGG
jgi:hypothetical protein